MSGFTKGPWKAHGSHIYAPDGEIIAVVHNPGSKESDYPLVPNRNLMAAAPELYEALTDIFAMMDEGLLVRDVLNDAAPDWAIKQINFVRRLGKARAALAKAGSGG